MKLISMAKEANDNESPLYCCSSQFGYGLTLYLDEDQCEKLGISQALKAGTQVTLQATAIVTEAKESLERDGDDKGTDVSISLQITDLGVNVGSVLKDAASILYPKYKG